MDPIFIFFLVLLVFMYVLLVRPQRQRARQHQDMLRSLQVGDEVLTTGGIFGEITGMDDQRVQLEIDADVKVAVSRAAIAQKVLPEDAANLVEEPDEAPEPEEAPEPAAADEPEAVGDKQAPR
ncbi:MAG TPA: preprotein translocase subunit YajC [Gaiellaceae bacterium]|nr:preprotein translocase subunit YajC [Gaiellaceae bacterium]